MLDLSEIQKQRESAQRCRDNNGECAAWANTVIVLCAEVERLRKALEGIQGNALLKPSASFRTYHDISAAEEAKSVIKKALE